jgi:hypothetical protein
LDYQSAILSIFEIDRISKVSEFLILWTTSFCSFKYISHIRDLKSIRISDSLDYRSVILNIFDIQYRGFQKYQNFWYFGLPVCSFKYSSHIRDLKRIRISDTLEYRSAILSIFDIQYRGFQKYQNFWYFGLPVCSFKYSSHIRDLKSIRISYNLDYPSVILCIFDIQYIGFQNYQDFWYFGLAVSAVLSIVHI